MANKKQLTPRLNRNEPNIVIDGGMEIWPEGTSRSVANNTSAYGAVLFKCANTSTGITLTTSQQASIPSGTNIPFSNQISKTAAGTLAAGTISYLSYSAEGYDINRLINDESSLVFWVKSSVASNRSVSIQNNSGSHAYVQQYNIATANVWQLVVLKLPALSTCPGTIEKTNGAGLNIIFSIVNGTTFQTSSLSSWIAGPKFSGVGEDTTWLTGTTHDFSIAGVMVLPGDFRSLSTNTSAYRFLRAGRNFQDELAMSERYYEITIFAAETSLASGSQTGLGAVAWRVQKRTTPTVDSQGNSTANSLRNQNTGATVTGMNFGPSIYGTQIRFTGAQTDNVLYAGGVTADARF